ncbi:MAG: mechanosensitive ion channel family protein [Desulfobacteraceae bacterium]|jgi:MscS family membrane protein
MKNQYRNLVVWAARKAGGLLLVLLVSLFLGLPPVVAVDAAKPPAPEGANATGTDATAPAEPLRPVDTESIDKAAEKVGKGIERFSEVAAGYLGDWVKHPTVAGISWIKLLVCLLLLLVVMIIERLFRWGLQRKIEAIPFREGVISWLRLFLNAIVKPLSLFIYVYGIYAALSPLYGHFEAADGSNLVLLVVKRSADIGGTVALFWFFYQLVVLLDARLVKWADGTDSNVDNMLVPLLGKTLRIFIVIIGIMMVLQNLTGIKIGPLLASLGIGGLAVALAAKDSIANFFGTLTILFDKPFQVGDRIVINAFDGTVENVGFRSTRIRLLNGHLVSIPNEKVVNSEVENVGRRPNIRWLTQIGITYDTPPDKVQEAVEILREILKDHEGMDPEFPPRVHFNGFNDWSLNITVVAWYHPPEYWDFQAWLQRTCIDILTRFETAGIDFAFPSQTLYLANEDKRQLKLQLLQGNQAKSDSL